MQQRVMKLFNPKTQWTHMCNLVCQCIRRYSFCIDCINCILKLKCSEVEKKTGLFSKIQNILKGICFVYHGFSIPCCSVRQTQTLLLNKHRCRQYVHCQQICPDRNLFAMPSATGGCCFGDTNADGQVQDRMSGLEHSLLALTVFHALAYIGRWPR